MVTFERSQRSFHGDVVRVERTIDLVLMIIFFIFLLLSHHFERRANPFKILDQPFHFLLTWHLVPIFLLLFSLCWIIYKIIFSFQFHPLSFFLSFKFDSHSFDCYCFVCDHFINCLFFNLILFCFFSISN